MNKPKIGDTPNQLEVRMLIDGKMWSGDDITKVAKENQELKEQNAELVKLLTDEVQVLEILDDNTHPSLECDARAAYIQSVLDKLRG